MIDSVVTFYQQGGSTMLITTTAGFIGVAIVFERSIKLYKKFAQNNDLFMARVKDYMMQGKVEEAMQLCNKEEGLLSKVVKSGLERVGCDETLVRQSMESSYLAQLPQVSKRLGYLSLIANAGMLFGLLGTVVGLIQQFAAVGAADPSQRAELMASGIAHAMNNTALGLIVALPMLIIHGVLSARAQHIVEDLEKGASQFLDWVNLYNYGEMGNRLSASSNGSHKETHAEKTKMAA